MVFSLDGGHLVGSMRHSYKILWISEALKYEPLFRKSRDYVMECDSTRY